MLLPRPLAGACLAALLLTLSTTLPAQEAPAAPPAPQAAAEAAPAAEAPRPEGLQLSRVAEQSLATSRLVEQSLQLLQPSPELEGLKGELAAMQESVGKLERETRQQLENSPGVEQVRATQTQWRYLREQLTQTLAAVQLPASALDEAMGRLAAEEEQWSQIKKQIATAAVPAEVRKQHQKATAEMADARRTLTSALKAHLAHVAQWQDLANRADEALLTLKQYESSQRSELLTSMQSPLWDLAAEDFEPNDGTWQALRQQIELAVYYLGQQLAGNTVVGGATLAILLFLWRMRSRPDTFAPLREGANLRFALVDRPFSTTLACTASLGLLLYQHPPLLLASGLGLLLLVPVVRLGMPQLPAETRPLGWLISLLFLVNSLAVLGEAIPAAQRLWIALSAAISAGVCLHALRSLNAEDGRNTAGWKTLRTALWLSFVMACVSLVGGVVGASALAGFLISGIANAAYAGLCLAVVTGILSDFASALLYLPAAERSHMVHHHRPTLARNISRVVRAIGLLLWLSFTLDQFLVRDDIWGWITSVLGSSLAVGNVSVSLGDALAIGLSLWLSFRLSRLLQFVFKEDIAPRTNLARGVPDAVATLMHYAIMVVGFLFAISAAGIDLSKVAILAGALGVGIGIGLQDVVNNFTSGLILLFEHHIKPGDIIQCGTLNGRVIHIGLRSSIVRTFDGAEVIVPNGQLVSAQVINWTHSDQQRRITIPVGAAYGSNPDTVIETLLAVAHADPDVMKTPEPSAFFLRFSPSAMDFELRAWVSTGEILNDATSRICTAVAHAFRERGIEIAFPQQDMHLRSLPPELMEALAQGRSAP